MALGRLTTEFRTVASMRSRSGCFSERYARKSINPSKAITVSERLSMVVICLGEEPPLNRAERSSHPPASLRKPTAKKARPFIS